MGDLVALGGSGMFLTTDLCSGAMNGDTLRRAVKIQNPQGLHMRPATAFVQRAEQLHGAVTVAKGDQRVNGKSLWDLLLLAAEQGTELVVEVSRADGTAALDMLAALLASAGPEQPPDAALN